MKEKLYVYVFSTVVCLELIEQYKLFALYMYTFTVHVHVLLHISLKLQFL